MTLNFLSLWSLAALRAGGDRMKRDIPGLPSMRPEPARPPSRLSVRRQAVNEASHIREVQEYTAARKQVAA